MTETISIIPLCGVPLVAPGDDLAEILAPLLRENSVRDEDVIVIAQKIVSKSENRYRTLNGITPTDEARELAGRTGKDPRLVELILQQSERVVRAAEGVIIVRHKLGFVLANAGIDHSNIEQDEERQRVLLLPEDPDRSADQIRTALATACGRHPGVIISDSWGRAWRRGTTGVAIGAAGVDCFTVKTGTTDLHGNELVNTEIGTADEIACAASLVMGQTSEAIPAVIVRGLSVCGNKDDAAVLVRPVEEDLFP